MNRRELLLGTVATAIAVAVPTPASTLEMSNIVATQLMVNGVPTGWVMAHRKDDREIVTGYGYTPTDWPHGWGWRMAPGMTHEDCRNDWHAMRRANHPGFIDPKGKDLTPRGEGRQDFAMAS